MIGPAGFMAAPKQGSTGIYYGGACAKCMMWQGSINRERPCPFFESKDQAARLCKAIRETRAKPNVEVRG